MGLLASFLCCGSDASDDANDKYHKQTATRSTPSKQTPQKPNTSSAESRDKSTVAVTTEDNGTASPHATSATGADTPVKAALEDDNSVNESDTLTVPNDESQKLDNSKVGNSANEDANQAVNGDGEADNATQLSKIVASVSENETDNKDMLAEKQAADDAASTFDLAAMQENQAFNSETGFLLGKKNTQRFGKKKCLVLDLDETLVHSSFKYLRSADFVIPVEIDNHVHHVYVIKRPGVDEFLKKVGQWYEVVVFTASVAKYGDPLLNKLDIHHSVHQRLFRDSCYNYQGNFIKNLSQLGRPLEDSIIIDNSPASYIFHPQHSVPISSWFSDTHDNELLDLLPLLEDLSKPNVDDVSLVLDINI